MMTAPHRATEWGWLLCGAIGIAWIAVELGRRRRLGRVLLDCGSLSLRATAQLGFGIVMSTMGLVEMFVVPGSRFQGFFWLVYGCTMLVSRSRRFQICEAGIYGRRFFRWEEIEEYYLSPRGGLGLKLCGKDWVWSNKVPAELWQPANQLLAARLPAQPGVTFAA
jgi:hypothetical protein